MIVEFPRNIQEKLKCYVYLYTDPRNGEIFYVGKGNGNRAFTHLKEESEKAKVKRILDIRSDGQEPRIEILVHGIEDDETAKKIEASVIDLIGITKLTNLQKGYESRDFGRMSIEQIIATYNVEKVEITQPALLININSSFRFGIAQIELYDATRSAWVIGDRKAAAEFAFTVYQGVVQEVYEVRGWYPNNSTFNTRKPDEAEISEERWEFVGRIAESAVRSKYLYKDVSDYMGTHNPIRYVNC